MRPEEATPDVVIVNCRACGSSWAIPKGIFNDAVLIATLITCPLCALANKSEKPTQKE